MIITIPVSPHLRAFALYSEGYPDGDIISLSSNSTLSITIKASLEGKLKAYRRPPYKRAKPLQAELLLRATPKMVKGTRRIIPTAETVRLVNRLIRTQMSEALIARIEIQKSSGRYAKDIIFDFMTELNIEDMISFDALKKQVDRYLQNQRKCSREYPPTNAPSTCRGSDSSSTFPPFGLIRMRGFH
ncbi:MAG: hypothetical protein AAFY91_05265 [Bacteroidota bacterium]